MNQILLAFCFLVMITPAIHAQSSSGAEYVEKYDEFTGEKSKTLKIDFNHDPNSENSASFIEKTIRIARQFDSKGKSNTFVVIVFFHKKSWQYLRCNTTNFLIDGKRIPLDVKHDGEIYDGGYLLEILGSPLIGKSFLEDLSNAKESIRFKICNDIYFIPKKYFGDIQKIAKANF